MSDKPWFRVLVVDDERPARQKLRRFLGAIPEVSDVQEADSAEAALATLRESSIALMFLDIEMPARDGLTLARGLPSGHRPLVIFVTAHARHAVPAFDLDAVDYLLKPYDRERLQRAVVRALDVMDDRAKSPVDRILVQDSGRTVAVPVTDIERCIAVGNYVEVHRTDGTRGRLRSTLTALATRLDATMFARVSRGAMVNVTRVVESWPVGHGDREVRLATGSIVRVSRRWRDGLTRSLSS